MENISLLLDEPVSLVSVIVPCFNYGWILSETLDSVLEQTYIHWECIIIDDGSTDNTLEIAAAYVKLDSRFRYEYQRNEGLSEARNTGLRLAKGKYIQFLDSDDLLAPRKFEVQVSYLEKHLAIDLVYSDVRYFMHGGDFAIQSRSFDMSDHEWMSNIPETADALLEALIRRNIMVVNAPLIRASLIKRVGFFNPSLRSYEDWEYWLRSALAGAKMHYNPIQDSWAFVRVHPASMTQNIQAMSKAILQVRQLLIKWLRDKNATNALAINQQCIMECYVGIAQKNMLEGNLFVGVSSFLKLASMTGNYQYYLKSIPFWLLRRLKTSVSN